MAEVEERMLQCDLRTIPLSLDELLALCEHLKIKKDLTDGKTKLAIVKIIRNTMENDVAELKEQGNISDYLDRFDKFVADLSMDKSNEENAEQPNKVESVNVLSSESTNGELKEISKDQPGKEHSVSTNIFDLNNLTRRDFKIIGQIGDPGQNDKLLYQSLVSQVQNALKKGYTELEIVVAVVRAVQAGLPLRAYLESIPDLTLAKLRKILRCHFREKTATELYQVLANLTQQQKEDPQSFLIRALTVRQQICFASKEADSQIKYDDTLVQGLFLHTVETGLLDDTIRSKIRPTLQNPKASDEDLLEAMGRAMAEEQERGKKLCRGRAKVASVSQDEKAVTAEKEKESKSQQDHVWAALKSVQSQLESVQSQMSTLQTTVNQGRSNGGNPGEAYNYKKPPKQPSNRSCSNCAQTGSYCNHCYLCGGINHFARDCHSRSNQGNGRWLLPRDRK